MYWNLTDSNPLFRVYLASLPPYINQQQLAWCNRINQSWTEQTNAWLTQYQHLSSSWLEAYQPLKELSSDIQETQVKLAESVTETLTETLPEAVNEAINETVVSIESSAEAWTEQQKDDLTAIAGIGPAIAQRLNEAGVTRFADIAAWTAEDVANIEAQVLGGRFTGWIDRDEWIKQAQALSAGI